MKTLADLKRECKNYKWKLILNSWYQSIPEFQAQWRLVGDVTRNGFSLLTDKNNDGKLIHSFIDFPKAKEIELIPDNEGYMLTIRRRNDDKTHSMIYELQKIEG